MLNTLEKITTKKQKRLGRGFGSGCGGHTVGKGTKGHNSRQGKKTPLWFEGGQLPLIKRLPYARGKFHFRSLQLFTQLVKLSDLDRLNGTDVTPESLKAYNLVSNTINPIKIVATGSVKKVGQVRGVKVTASARKAIEEAGGSLA